VQPHYNDKQEHTVSLVTARIVQFHVHEDVLLEEKSTSASATQTQTQTQPVKPVVDWQKLKPVGRLGGDSYTFVDNEFEIKRPSSKELHGNPKN
jgi:flavin reductase (DIM6/NTAB) family NADH-FMN oxidoreductase RutF